MTWKFYDLKIVLTVLIGIPLIASTNIDCGGRSFHCLNTTHFRICVDLGGGLSTTVDDFVIPCPSPTVCSHSNRFECEFPPSVSIPLAVPITLTSATNELESATTLAWEEIVVPTTLSFDASAGHLELQNNTNVSTKSQLVEVTSPASVISISENETVTEIIPIPNTTFKPQITTEDILVANTILLNGTDTVVDVSINKITVIPEVTGNATQANISASNITENKINETTVNPKIEVIASNATEANISTSNVIDKNVEETTANSQMEVVTSTAFASNTNTLNMSENGINERKAIKEVEAVTRTMTGSNNTVTSNDNENNFVTKTYETSTDINTEIRDTSEANLNINSKTTSLVEDITMDTSVTLGTPITTAENGRSASRVDDTVTKVSTTPKITKTAETMNTISVTTTYPKITAHNSTSVLIHDSVNQSVIPVEINRKKAIEVIDSITTAVPEIVNTDVNATLVEEVMAATNAINIDITTILPSVQHNQSFVTETNSYLSNINETTIVTPSPETVSATISKGSSFVENFVTQNPIFSVNTESNAQKTASTTLQATEIISNTDDNSILNLKTPINESTTIVVYNKNVADKVKQDINKINATTTISVPITTQKIDVVTLDSNNLVGEILVTTTISNVNTESNVKESTEASNTIDFNLTINVDTPVENSLTSTIVPGLKTISNVPENTDVFNVPKILHNIDTDATVNSNILIEKLTSPTISEANITNTSALLNSNDVDISSTISPNFLTTDTSELIKLTEIKYETTTLSSVSEIDLITTEHKLRENTDAFETTINNFSPLLDTNAGNNNTVAVENKKAAGLSLNNNTVTTTTDNMPKIQTSTSEHHIRSTQNFTPEYLSTFSESFGDPTTSNTKLNMNDRQLNFETSTSYVLPTQLTSDMAGISHNIPKVISLNKTNVSPTTNDTRNAAIDNITSIMEEGDLPPTVSVTEYLITDAPGTEAQLKMRSGNMIDKEDTSITPNLNAVYITTSQNEILKTEDNANDFGNVIVNQADISPSPNHLSTESSLLDHVTTHIIATPQSASKVQTPNTSSYNLPTVKESTILTTASILESNINATGIEIANESTDAVETLFSNTNFTERTSTMSITITPKGTSVAPDAIISTETLESTTQNNKALYDTDVPEVQTIPTVKGNNLNINTQVFNVPTTMRSLEISVNVNTESELKNPHSINTDINFPSIAPSTEGNVISSSPLSGNDLPINNKSPNNDKVTTVANVDKSTLSASLQINKLNTNDATKTQTDLLNTTLTKGTKINFETGTTVTTSITRSQTDELLTETGTTTEYVRNSNLQPLNSQNNVNSEHGVANQPETETSTQTTRYVDTVTPSVQGTLKSEKPQTGTPEILEVKKTNIPVQDVTNNLLTTDLREKPTTIGGIVASTSLSPAINAVSNQDAIISATSSPAMVSAGSNTNNDSLSTNIATWETAIVLENISSDILRSINTIAPETIPAVEHENKNTILTVMNSTSSPHNGREFNNPTNILQNVPFNTHEASANHYLITSEPVATTDRPADAGKSISFTIQSIGPQSVNDEFYTSQTNKNLPQPTSSTKVSPGAINNPDAKTSVGSSNNINQNVLTPKTVTWQRPTVQENISGVQRSTNNDALEIIPLTQNENQVDISANVANKSTASPSNGSHISNIANPLENVVLNMKEESVSDNRTMSAANVTTPSAGISTSTEYSSSMIQSTGSLSVTSSNADNNIMPLNVNNSNVSVLPDRVKIVPQLPNINSGVINQHDKKSTIAETLPNSGILKVLVSISENTQNTDNVVKEVKNAVKDSKWHPPPESVKNNFSNISLSMQSISILSISTTDVKLNVTETTFTNSSVEFHTSVSKTNVNAQPSTDGNTKSLPNRVVEKTSPLNDDSNLSNNDITNIPVVIIDREKVNKNHNVNIELSFVQNSSYPLTKTSASNIQTATKPHITTATEAAVRRAQTTGSTIGSTHPVVTTGQLSILNTVKVDVERTNVEKNLNFDCENRRRGRYSDNKDCRKFYVCIGLRLPIEGLCPVNTVFSEVKKQCTKNLSHCIRQNQFKCVTNGRFSDVMEQNVYYICVKNHREEFVRFKFQCQNGYRLNKLTVRCVEDETEPSNNSISNESEAAVEKSSSSNNRDYSKIYDNNHSTNENAKDNGLKTVKDKSSSERRKGDEDFECEEEGKFPEPKSCRKYYVCSKSNRSEEYRQRRKKCNSDEVFHKDKKKCVDADSFECS
ncbi:mucin-17-like [Hyposmocoma kahamanoa]|uniref:mucin-17-like n=1 Tax=Hyposmocoma kahamanoa TaxID=1477025 RepID=UPI000E6D6FDB|nr:mucin-17-like [Hyposmocoma kahamanoa]